MKWIVSVDKEAKVGIPFHLILMGFYTILWVGLDFDAKWLDFFFYKSYIYTRNYPKRKRLLICRINTLKKIINLGQRLVNMAELNYE